MLNDWEEVNKEEAPLDDWEDIVEVSPYRDFVSERPIWIYATFNPEVIVLWRSKLPWFVNEFAERFNRKVMDNRKLNNYSAILQVVLKTEDEYFQFYEDAKKCGFYLKKLFVDEIPERGTLFK